MIRPETPAAASFYLLSSKLALTPESDESHPRHHLCRLWHAPLA